MRPLLIALAAAVVAASVTLACGQDEEAVPSEPTATATGEATPAGVWTAPRGTPVPKPGWKAVGFANVTASAPEGISTSPLGVYTVYAPSGPEPHRGPVIWIEVRGGDGGRVVIDALTGAIVDEVGGERARTALQETLDTVRVSEFDREAAPWPYADSPAPIARDTWGSITYPIPEPSARIAIGGGASASSSDDAGGTAICSYSLWVSNGRSEMFINACTGEVFPQRKSITPEDTEAFERILKAIEVEP